MFTTLTMTQLISLRDSILSGITKCSANRSWTHDGKTYTRSSIPELQNLMAEVETEINRRGGAPGGSLPTGRRVRFIEI